MVSYIGRFAPAVAVPLASSKGGEPTTELTSSRSNTTHGDATPGDRCLQRSPVRGCRQLTVRSEAFGCWTGRAAGEPSRLNWRSVTSRSWLLTPVKVPPFVPATRAPLA